MAEKKSVIKVLPEQAKILSHWYLGMDLPIRVEKDNPMKQHESVVIHTITMLDVENNIWEIKGRISYGIIDYPKGGTFSGVLDYGNNTGELIIEAPEIRGHVS